MTPNELYLQAIKFELETDPEGRGYAGLSPSEQAELLNNPYIKTVEVQQEQTPRIAMIINQIAFAPNLATEDDVNNALAMPEPELGVSKELISDLATHNNG